MAPEISPKKTWEGLIGAIVATTIGAALIFVYVLDDRWWLGAIVGVLGVITATCGDLIESAVSVTCILRIWVQFCQDMGAFWIVWILFYLQHHRSGSFSNSYSISRYKVAMMSEDNSLKLVFDEPKQRVKPPRHFADLDSDGRKALAVELGIPAFRANQVATHFFTHYNDDTESWSDIPKEIAVCLPRVHSEVDYFGTSH